ncbi:MAG: hypothetical protein HRU17_01115 [Polyangiaceae bacterium]|nr:hypothetical protein [Polyangiaceae bacterium]
MEIVSIALNAVALLRKNYVVAAAAVTLIAVAVMLLGFPNVKRWCPMTSCQSESPSDRCSHAEGPRSAPSSVF